MSKLRASAVLVLVLVVLVGVLVFCLPRDTRPGASSSVPERAAPNPVVAIEPTAPKERVEVVPAPARKTDAAQARVLRVRVVDADSDAPVAGAQVEASPAWTPAARPVAGAKAAKATAKPTARPTIPPTDVHGETEFACEWAGIYLQASTPGGLFGSMSFPKVPDLPLVLKVRADRTLLVKVESQHASVGVGNVPVGIGEIDADRSGIGFRRHGTQPTKAATGIAEFRHVQDWLHTAAGKARAWIDIPQQHVPSVAISEADTNGQPIVLQLPPTGVLLVRVVGSRSGRPMAGVDVYAEAYASLHALSPVPVTSLWGHQKTDPNGEARFGPIGLGLWVGAWPMRSPDRVSGKDRHEGPRVEGEERLLVLPWSEDQQIVQGIAVTADGEPWPWLSLSVQVHGDGRLLTPMLGLFCHTDEDGRFHFVAQGGWKEHAEVLLCAMHTDRPQPMAWLRLGPLAEVGPIDVGTVVVDPGPVLAAGRVVAAADGSAIDGVLMATAWDQRGEELGSESIAGLGNLDAAGRFLVCAPRGRDLAGGKVKLSLYGKGLVDTAVEGPVGRTDWVVPMHRRGVVKGRLRCEGDVVAAECNVMLSLGSMGYGKSKYDPDGTFLFQDVPPGTYDLKVDLTSEWQMGRERTRITIPGIVLADDTVNEDPRLADIPVQAAGQLCEVTVTSEQGSPVQGATIRIDEKAPAMVLPTTDGAGRVRLRLRGTAKALVTCAGFCPWIGDAKPGPMPVVLVPAR